MNSRLWKTAAFLTAAGTLALMFIGYPFGFGYLLGCLVSILLYKRIESFWTGVLDSGSAQRGTGFFHFLVNYGMMAGSLLLSALLPEYLNIFACAAGLMLIKFTTIVDMIIHH